MMQQLLIVCLFVPECMCHCLVGKELAQFLSLARQAEKKVVRLKVQRFHLCLSCQATDIDVLQFEHLFEWLCVPDTQAARNAPFVRAFMEITVAGWSDFILLMMDQVEKPHSHNRSGASPNPTHTEEHGCGCTGPFPSCFQEDWENQWTP